MLLSHTTSLLECIKNLKCKTIFVALTVEHLTINICQICFYKSIYLQFYNLEMVYLVLLQDTVNRNIQVSGRYLLRKVRMPLCSQSCHLNQEND